MVDSYEDPVGRIRDGDSVIFCCRRGDREIQLTEAFTDPEFSRFVRPDLEDLHFVILTMYHEKFRDLPIAFAPKKVKEPLGELISRAGLSQLRVAESEKFVHITYFLDGGESKPFKGEEVVRIPSPKNIPFDQVPELSLVPVTEQVIEGIKKGYDFIAVNIANGDVIGHTSNHDSKIQCASLVDSHLGEIIKTAALEDFVVLITADHGNLEEMVKADGSPHVSHTTNLVPFILIDPQSSSKLELLDGKLADVAPTILSVLGIQPSATMNGVNLAPGHDWGRHRRLLLVILDGWGLGKKDSSNPIFIGNTPVWDQLLNNYAHSKLHAAGEAVGLKAHKAGNSEAGHMNIGAGSVVLQDDVRLDLAMQDGSFYNNETFLSAIECVKKNGANLHLLGLLTEKSSHGSIDYLLALLRMAKKKKLEKVYLHLIFDGRSTDPGSAPALLVKFEQQVQEIGIGEIVSGIGRGIALDRDGNYDKTKKAFEAFVLGIGIPYKAT
jgi:2,3-bisphosphoglycerate-independent phosphoglycerate mutase